MIYLLLVLLITLATGVAEATTRYAGPAGTVSSGSCTSSTNDTSACTVARLMAVLAAGDVGILLNGTYTGANYMLNSSFKTADGTSNSSRITVQAETEGSVIINGQGVRKPVEVYGNYWTFQGFDAGNAGGGSGNATVMNIAGGVASVGLEFKRIVAYNAGAGNNHVWSFGDCTSCLFEDIAGFGTARNIFVEGAAENGTIIRRAWLRWEGGQVVARPSVPLQAGYEGGGGFTYENIVTVWNPVLDTSGTASGDQDGTVSIGQRDIPTTFADNYRGIIGYALGSLAGWAINNGIQLNLASGGAGISFIDVFVDIRSESGAPKPFGLNGSSVNSIDRATTLRLSTQSPSDSASFTITNRNECTAAAGTTGSTIGGCPNFYTGVGTAGAIGSRACFEYTNAVLGSVTATQALWPWRMDNRIKAARAREGAAALGGVAGTGYAANTVTSEIASRYGATPVACNRAASGLPNAPSNLVITAMLLLALIALAMSVLRRGVGI